MFCYPGFNFIKEELKKNDFNYLEIGIFDGDSLATLANLFPEKKFYGIDPFIEDGYTTHVSQIEQGSQLTSQRDNTIYNITGLNNVIIYEYMSKDFAKLLTYDTCINLNVGWVLIDGSHHYNDVILDIMLSMMLIGKKRGGIIFDDVNLPDVGQAYSQFLNIFDDRITGTHVLHEHIVAHDIN